jgi:hypothetical protein
MTNPKTNATPLPLWQYWRGLAGWNFYFLVKFALLWAGYLNFHPMLNLVFLAFLLVPMPKYKLHRLRHWIAIPLGIGLFWHDTWLPGPESIFSQGSQLAGFSASYIWDLITRFINWNMVGAFFLLLVLWLFISQWLRVTVWSPRLWSGWRSARCFRPLPYGLRASRRQRRPPRRPRPRRRPRRAPLPPAAIFRRRPNRRPRPI